MSKPPELKLPTESIGAQMEKRAAWNSVRSGTPDFYTVGYTRRHIDQFVALLQSAGVVTVIDIRHTPLSMHKPDFSKSNLIRHLHRVGIDYLHIPRLGVPRDIRGRAAQMGTREVIWEWYDRNVLPDLSVHAFLNWGGHPVAFLCTELDPTSCHRHRLALRLERYGFNCVDL